jgi:cytochrome c biogenesis protein CcdA
MTGVFFGGSLVAATVAGMIALFSPCCISVMLPAYFASSFQLDHGTVREAHEVR